MVRSHSHRCQGASVRQGSWKNRDRSYRLPPLGTGWCGGLHRLTLSEPSAFPDRGDEATPSPGACLRDFHQVEIGLAALLGDKKELLPVRMPGRVVIFPRMARDPAQGRAVGVHDIDLVIAVAVAGERDPL